MGKTIKLANAAAVIAVAFSFALYAASFEPFGVAEFAYVFAVPAILACRFLCGKTDARTESENRSAYLAELARCGLPTSAPEKTDAANAQKTRASGGKIWRISTAVFTFAAWCTILAWLRHVYPPAGYAAVVFLAAAVGAFVYPWFALLPSLLPSLRESQSSRLIKLFGAASLWVALEWLR